MKKLIIGLVVIILIGAGVFVYSKKEAKAPVVDNSMEQNHNLVNQIVSTASSTQTNDKASTTPAYTSPQSAGGGENTGSNVQVYEVDYDGNSYSPNVSNINVGDYIFFKNKSSGDFWPVSGSANTLAAYPNFNPIQPLAAGKEYKFQFTKAGSFNFGDNLHANMVFTVNVGQ